MNDSSLTIQQNLTKYQKSLLKELEQFPYNEQIPHQIQVSRFFMGLALDNFQKFIEEEQEITKLIKEQMKRDQDKYSSEDEMIIRYCQGEIDDDISLLIRDNVSLLKNKYSEDINILVKNQQLEDEQDSINQSYLTLNGKRVSGIGVFNQFNQSIALRSDKSSLSYSDERFNSNSGSNKTIVREEENIQSFNQSSYGDQKDSSFQQQESFSNESIKKLQQSSYENQLQNEERKQQENQSENQQENLVINDQSTIQENFDDYTRIEKQVYTYQRKIIDKVKKQWEEDQDDKKYGSILYLDTGSGKSYIAIILIKYLFGLQEDLNMLSDEQIKIKRSIEVLKYDENAQRTKKVFFLVPTNNLVEQQANVIDSYTDLKVGRYQGGAKNRKIYKIENWKIEFQKNQVFVFIAKKFYDLLIHGQLLLEDVDLLILDEAHHCQQDHIYNLIMNDFFYANLNEKKKVPRILSLTASPIKQKISPDKIYQYEIKEFLQTLSNNLYSRFISIDQQDLNEMKNEAEVKLKAYKSEFQANVDYIKLLEQNLIKKLIEIVNITSNLYKIIDYDSSDPTTEFLKLLNGSVEQEFIFNQDEQVLKFLNLRKKLLDLDTDISKKQIDLSLHQDEDKIIILLVIVILKNANNLILELGPAGIKFLLKDLSKEIIQRQDKLSKYKQIISQLIDEFLQTDQSLDQGFLDSMLQQTSAISGKVQKLIEILNQEYDQRKEQQLKAIIFVKDRTVAEYLRRILDHVFNSQDHLEDYSSRQILEDNSESLQFEDSEVVSSKIEQRKVNKFRFGVALGFQGRSVISKAVKSTKKGDAEGNLTEFLPQFSHAKISNSQLMEIIEKFKMNKINVLIATSVIEEGLDVSTCNLVICLNEIMNVKSFIQTKGRARQKNSKYIFMCAEQEEPRFQKEIEGFRKTIESIQEIAYFGETQITPDENVVIQKQKIQQDCLRTVVGAKILMRDAPIIFESLCQELQELINSKKINLDEIEGHKMSPDEIQNSKKYDIDRQEQKAIVRTLEKTFQNKRFYLSFLIMPKILKKFLDHIKGDKGFAKKKDSENHVYLKAVRILNDQKLFDEYMFPNLIHLIKLPVAFNHSLEQQASLKSNQLSERMLLQEEQKQFNKEKKDQRNKHSFIVQKDNLRKPLDINNLHCIIIDGATKNDKYPFQDTQVFIGLIQDQSFDEINYQFILQNDSKQKRKNHAFLKNLSDQNLIKENDIAFKNQSKDEIKLTKKSFKLTEIIDSPNREYIIMQLKIFHVWSFYVFYNAQHRFFKRLIKGKFSFSILFKPLIKAIFKDNRRNALKEIFLQKVYKINIDKIKQYLDNIDKQDASEEIGAFIVPIRFENGQYQIDYTLIGQVIQNIFSEIISFWFQDDCLTNNYISQYHINYKDMYQYISKQFQKENILTQIEKRDYFKNKINYIWKCKSNGNLYSILSSEPVNKEVWDRKQIVLLPNQYKRERFDWSESQLLAKYADHLTVQQHYFAKTGIYLKRSQNEIFYKCSKMRHFLDYTKQKQGAEEQKQRYKINVLDLEQVNTQFDVPQQLMEITPLTYEYYQVLQASVFFMAQLNEMINIKEFLNKYFKDLPIVYPQPDEVLGAKRLSLYQSIIKLPDQSENIVTAQDYFLKYPEKIIEALTSPTANRPEDYERLEFYGDSVISFLVILELYLCGDPLWAEGELDFHRIRLVSNMNFTKVNQQFKIHDYMISEQSKLYNDIIPEGFDSVYYQNKLKQKHINEIEQKIIYLKKLDFFLEQEQLNQVELYYKQGPDYHNTNDIVTEDYREMVQMFLYQKDLSTYLKNNNPKSFEIYQQESKRQDPAKHEDLFSRIGQRWIDELHFSLPYLQQIVVRENIYKCEKKLYSERIKRDRPLEEIKQKSQTKSIQSKQLADVVESIIGALSCNCGLATAYNQLKTFGIISYSLEDQDQQLQRISQITSELNQQQLIHIAEIETILGYQFNNKSLLMQALTHKSIKEVRGNHSKQINDYERLEFLGDSILNLLVAQHFFLKSQNNPDKFKPKELHKQKTSVVNNVLLSLAIIENKLYPFIEYNQSSLSFKRQFDDYVKYVEDKVDKMSTKAIADEIKKNEQIKLQFQDVQSDDDDVQGNLQSMSQFSSSTLKTDSTKSTLKTSLDHIIDLDTLYEKNLKIFGDIFESIIGAVFIDSKSLEVTSKILFGILDPYITVYSDLKNLQDHKRTKLLELWNSKSYAKSLRITHKMQEYNIQQFYSEILNNEEYVYFKGYVQSIEVRRIKFPKDQKNKVRKFYKDFCEFIECFIFYFEERYQQSQASEVDVLKELKTFRKRFTEISFKNNTQKNLQQQKDKQQQQQQKVFPKMKIFKEDNSLDQ